MGESEIIKSVYDEKIRQIGSTFMEAFMTAKSDEQRKEAEDHFRAGIAAARAARERALTLVPA